jgi:hypothetical protein
VTFIDNNSRYIWIYFLRHKSDDKSVLRDFWNLVETQFSTKIKKFKSDNGGEYVNIDVSEFLAGKGTIHELSPPYAHESNGRPEHMNHTIITMVRTMTVDVNDELPLGLWAEPALTAIYLQNRLPHAVFKNKKSPYEQRFGEKPHLAHLYPFGTKCYVHIPYEKRIGMSKLGPRGMKAYVVGYTKSSKVL